MAQEPKISTQTAILLGSVIISIGVFLGLRGRATESAAPNTADSTPSSVATPHASSVVAPNERATPPETPAPLVPQAVDRTAVAAEVAAELEKQKKTLIEKCLAPSLAKNPVPKSVKFTFNWTFDAEGKQISRGLMEHRDASRPDVTECLSRTMTAVAIAPKGQSVFVEVPFDLP